MVTDTVIYVNEAGNPYMINEIQYFVSDVVFHHEDGSNYLIDDIQDIHYVDTDIPSTMTWEVADKLPAGNYSGFSFIFGISEEKNQSYMFANPPERDMFWPEFLGGGYHYLKLNGKWIKTDSTESPFNFHLGIGQTYDTLGNITGYVQNYFTVTLPASSFSLSKDETKEIFIIMNIENWFRTPTTWDHNFWGGYIMQNQAAMQTGAANGWDVFSVSINP